MKDDARAEGDPGRGAADRLESWKEIAAYLRRDVRTVQRWEQTDGLPVHRHRRAHRPLPYAYKSELDAWWTTRSDRVAPVEPESPVAAARSPRTRVVLTAVVALAVAVAAIGAYTIVRFRTSRTPAGVEQTRPATADTRSARGTPERSIAVLPFLDLSEGMTNEEFADGITEELIDHLNKVAGLRVPAPTSSFYFKNKHVPVAEIGRSLRVSYLLDGSVRKAGGRVRVSARLIRADNADVIWTETYDREWRDILALQDDVANEVTRALQASIATNGGDTASQ